MALTIDPTNQPSDHAQLVEDLLDEFSLMRGGGMGRMLKSWHDCGVSVIQLSAAHILASRGPQTMGQLADALGISVASATGVVARMEDRGLVHREHGTTDRRLVIVTATEGAGELFRSLELQRREYLGRMFRELTDEQIGGLLVGMRAFRAARERAEDQRA